MNTNEHIENYILDNISTPPEVLIELERATHLRCTHPRMLSGKIQGQLLYMLCKINNSSSILELGTFTGYSAISMAAALPENGILHTIEINDELEDIQQEYIHKSGFEDKIQVHFGDALEIIPELDGDFDFVFIDANKRHYCNYFEAIFNRVLPGGIIIADNTLWSGKVVEPVNEKDEQTKGILAFNKMIKYDERIEKVILPFRDGMTIIRKK